jgi:hypothetical protein
MKRIALFSMGLMASLTSASQAQLSMQMGNGWNFTFAGNVNAFVTHEFFNKDGATFTPGGIVPAGTAGVFDETRIRTGLLPSFAVFDAKGKEGNTDLGVHFGFAPEIQCATGVHDCFGAQIDMRQVYLTVGGKWGQILAGRELGLFGRQNILTDQTLFGVGATGSVGDNDGSGGGTTLGRIGFGYIYPNFNAQVTYSTPAGRPAQLSVGLFEASSNVAYHEIQLPRIESELVYTHGQHKVWVGGLIQSTKSSGTDTVSAAAWGGSGGFRWQSSQFSLTGSGYYGKGLGTTLMFNSGTGAGICSGGTCGTNGSDDLRKSYGFIGQVTMMPAANSKTTFAVSYGSSYLKESSTEEAAATTFRTENTLVSGGIYHQATKSLKLVGEVNYNWTKDQIDATATNKSVTPAIGLMLFF